MTFSSGVHIACGYVGARALGGAVESLMASLVWSQTMAAAGTTTQVAPATSPLGAPSFEVSAAVDVYAAYGAAPDATDGPRILVRAGETRNVFCSPGDKLAWIAA